MKRNFIRIALILIALSAPLFAQRPSGFSSRYVTPATNDGLFSVLRRGGISIDPQDAFDPRALVLSYNDRPIVEATNYPDARTVPGFYLSYGVRFDFERVNVVGRNVYFRTRVINGVHYQFSGVIGTKRVNDTRIPLIKGVLTRMNNRRIISQEEISFVHAAV